MKIIPRRNVSVGWPDIQTVWDCILSGRLIEGADLASFEKEFAAYIGAKYAVAIPSARMGLWIILKALQCREGEGVILSAFNFPVMPSVIRCAGLKPVFADVLPPTCNIDPRDIADKLSPDVKCLLVTHLFGQPADMGPIMALARQHGLRVIEDCAHACGAEYDQKKVGAFGDAACFSFGIGKSVVTFGGGMITTDDDGVYQRIQEVLAAFRSPPTFEILGKLFSGFFTAFLMSPGFFFLFGYPIFYILDLFGHDLETILDSHEDQAPEREEDLQKFRTKFSNVQAALGRGQLRRLDPLNRKRVANTQILTEGLSGCDGIRIPPAIRQAKSSGLYCPAEVAAPLALKKYLIRRGVDSKISSQVDCSGGHCRLASALSGRIIKIPNSPGLSQDEVEYVAGVVAGFFARNKCA